MSLFTLRTTPEGSTLVLSRVLDDFNRVQLAFKVSNSSRIAVSHLDFSSERSAADNVGPSKVLKKVRLDHKTVVEVSARVETVAT